MNKGKKPALNRIVNARRLTAARAPFG